MLWNYIKYGFVMTQLFVITIEEPLLYSLVRNVLIERYYASRFFDLRIKDKIFVWNIGIHSSMKVSELNIIFKKIQ